VENAGAPSFQNVNATDREILNALNQAQIARWRHDGFLSPFPLLDDTELRVCRDGLDRFEKWLGAPVNASDELKWRTMPYLILPWAAKLAREPRILDVVEDLLGPDILIFTSTFFIKEPHSPTIAAWHQDSTYYGLEPKEQVTVWVALSDANEAAGCMDALSFSGNPRQLSHVSRVVKNSVNRASQVITESLDEGTPVAMPLTAGSFSMHHGLCPHRSGPNTANHRRIGLGLNFIPTSVRPVGPIKPAAMLVRGVDRYNHFEGVEPPQVELDAQSVATHDRATTLYRNCYLEEEARHAQLSA
jgi:non-heme Fe2+,alpha-ketoglutarate-dependent halogenase